MRLSNRKTRQFYLGGKVNISKVQLFIEKTKINQINSKILGKN